jgi:hypothetical protein
VTFEAVVFDLLGRSSRSSLGPTADAVRRMAHTVGADAIRFEAEGCHGAERQTGVCDRGENVRRSATLGAEPRTRR